MFTNFMFNENEGQTNATNVNKFVDHTSNAHFNAESEIWESVLVEYKIVKLWLIKWEILIFKQEIQ